MSPKKPLRKTRGSETGRPIMVLLDLLGRRWVLRILWELRDGPLTFRALQNACSEVSPTTLNTRLKELREADFVAQTERGYALTPWAEDLLNHFPPLNAWAENWAGRKPQP